MSCIPNAKSSSRQIANITAHFYASVNNTAIDAHGNVLFRFLCYLLPFAPPILHFIVTFILLFSAIRFANHSDNLCLSIFQLNCNALFHAHIYSVIADKIPPSAGQTPISLFYGINCIEFNMMSVTAFNSQHRQKTNDVEAFLLFEFFFPFNLISVQQKCPKINVKHVAKKKPAHTVFSLGS